MPIQQVIESKNYELFLSIYEYLSNNVFDIPEINISSYTKSFSKHHGITNHEKIKKVEMTFLIVLMKFIYE